MTIFFKLNVLKKSAKIYWVKLALWDMTWFCNNEAHWIPKPVLQPKI